MTDTDTQQKRDIELEFYRERLTEFANSDHDFSPQWAESVLRIGEGITGPGVDMTDEERDAAVKLLETPEA